VTAERVDAPGTGLAARVHWLTATAAGSAWDWLELVSTLTDGGEVEVRGPRTFYRSHHVVAGLVHVLSDPIGEGQPDVCVDVPGAACDWLGLERLSAIVGAADALTRVDLAVDHGAFTPEQLAEADRAGDIRTRTLSSDWSAGIRGRNGQTYTLGSSQSDRQLVAYDRRGYTRLELRLRRGMAGAAREALLGASEALLAASVGLIRGMVEFVDAASDTNPSRRALLPWWSAFVGDCERTVATVAARVASSVERKVAWLRKSVAPSLAALVAGGLELGELVAAGAMAGRERHRALTHQMRVLGWADAPIGAR
jgi:DNA relaxase NicK